MYRAEFFSYDVQYKDFALFDDNTELSVDYIAWDASQVKIPGKLLAVIKGDLVHITRDGATVMDGLVSGVEFPEKNTTAIKIKPLLCCLQNDFALNALSQGEQQSTDIADFISTWLTHIYVDGFSAYEDIVRGGGVLLDERPIIPITIINNCPSAARPFVYTADLAVSSAQTVFSTALTQYRVLVDAYIDVSALRIVLTLSQISDAITIESDLDNCIERSINIGNSFGGTNKMIIYRFNSGVAECAAFYLYKTGRVDDGSGEDMRIVPVVEKRAYLQYSDTWWADASQKARDEMEPKAFDNEIDLTYMTTDKVIDPLNIKMGTLATIRAAGVDYQSILTGKTLQNNTVRLVFGCVRVDLTKQLIMDRRASN